MGSAVRHSNTDPLGRDGGLSAEEFDSFSESRPSGEKWELVQGFLYFDGVPIGTDLPLEEIGRTPLAGMSGSSPEHAEIVGNLVERLRPAMRLRGCSALGGDVYVGPAGQGGRAIPDVLVRCGPRAGDPRKIDDPVLVVEVLSPSTMDFDRGRKLEFYKSLPSLSDVTLVYQDEMRVEHWNRTDAGWMAEILTQPDDRLEFRSVAFELSLSDLYDGVALPERTGRRLRRTP